MFNRRIFRTLSRPSVYTGLALAGMAAFTGFAAPLAVFAIATVAIELLSHARKWVAANTLNTPEYEVIQQGFETLEGTIVSETEYQAYQLGERIEASWKDYLLSFFSDPRTLLLTREAAFCQMGRAAKRQRLDEIAAATATEQPEDSRSPKFGG